MDLIYVNTDITTVTSGLVGHGVNCSGGFGSGVAGAIRKKWPVVREKFMDNGTGAELLGSAHILRLSPVLFVANCYTQQFYGNDGKVYASVDAIQRSVEFCYSWFDYTDTLSPFSGVDEFHFPKIGCGLGGLDWETQVRPIFEELNSKYGKTTYIHSI